MLIISSTGKYYCHFKTAITVLFPVLIKSTFSWKICWQNHQQYAIRPRVKLSYLGKHCQNSKCWEWVAKGLRSHSTHYRSYRGRFLQAWRPNQQCQSTRGSQFVVENRDQTSILHSHRDHAAMLQYKRKATTSKHGAGLRVPVRQKINHGRPVNCQGNCPTINAAQRYGNKSSYSNIFSNSRAKSLIRCGCWGRGGCEWEWLLVARFAASKAVHGHMSFRFSNPQHVLHNLLLPPSAASQNYDLRPRQHDRQLPAHAIHLMACELLPASCTKTHISRHYYSLFQLLAQFYGICGLSVA